MNTYVFLGPTLTADEARAAFGEPSGATLTVLPPVQQGDVLRLLRRRPAAIGIVDGLFETAPAVWHKEILLAMAAGVRVLGAAGMGALRAVELQPFGMVGVGQVYAWYRDGLLVADDEVAVAHGPAESGYRRLSDALVDIRDSCAAAVAEGVLPREAADALVRTAAALPYQERSCRRVAIDAAAEGMDAAQVERWSAFVAERGPGLKQRDAAELVKALREFPAEPPAPRGEDDRPVARTVFLEALCNEIELARAARLTGPLPEEGVALRGGKTLEELRRDQLLRVMAAQEAERLEWTPAEEEIQERADGFLQERGFASTAALRAWMEQEGVTEEQFRRHLTSECYIGRLLRQHGLAVERGLAAELHFATAGKKG